MKKKTLFKAKILVAAIMGFTLGIITPLVALQTNAASNVTFESTLNVANVTAGDTTYKPSVNAKVDDVVKLELFYHNTEPSDSGLNAKNVTVKIAVPQNSGTSHIFDSTVSGSNISTFNRSATVNTSINTNMSYISGSAFRRHNTGTNENQNWVTENIPDSVVGSGFTISELKPCFNFQETITILARVNTPVVSIVKKVKKEDDSSYSTEITATPGEKIDYSINFKNEGNVMLNNVVIRDSLPPNLEFVKGSAQLINSLHPNGMTISDKIIDSGVIVGNYGPGINGIVRLKAIIPKDITGCHDYINIGVVKSDELAEFYNTAKVNACAPEEQKFTIKAIKFKDDDKDTKLDGDEHRLPDWQISLKGEGIEKTSITNQNGEALFTDLPAGEYTLTETMKSGWENVTPLSQKVVIEKDCEQKEFVVFFANTPTVVPPTPTPTPVTPASIEEVPPQSTLPTSGPLDAVAGTFGTISLASAGIYYRKTRAQLKSAKRFIK